MRECDLLVIGSGPAGMSAAINGASEGLSVCMIDSNTQLGGQAVESNAIENYPGFPEGITGKELMTRFAKQATKFQTRIFAPVRAVKLNRADDGRISVVSDDYMEFRARTALISIGLSYRRLEAEGIGEFMGRGIFYGLPVGSFNPRTKCKIVVVGGANSAGQAVMKLATNPNAHITMIIRRKIHDQMSTYLIERIKEMPNVMVKEGIEVRGVSGKHMLQHVHLSDGSTLCATAMNIFIGAVPKTMWLEDALLLDERKFIQTGAATHIDDRFPHETSMKGVFAAGDVRAGSVKRIAAAIGEGGAALQEIHNRLASF